MLLAVQFRVVDHLAQVFDFVLLLGLVGGVFGHVVVLKGEVGLAGPVDVVANTNGLLQVVVDLLVLNC